MKWWIRGFWAVAAVALVTGVVAATVANLAPHDATGATGGHTLQVGATDFELTPDEPGREIELVIPIVNTGRVPRRIIGLAEG